MTPTLLHKPFDEATEVLKAAVLLNHVSKKLTHRGFLSFLLIKLCGESS